VYNIDDINSTAEVLPNKAGNIALYRDHPTQRRTSSRIERLSNGHREKYTDITTAMKLIDKGVIVGMQPESAKNPAYDSLAKKRTKLVAHG
jgi:hypothetical protein